MSIIGPGVGKCAEPIKLSLSALKTEKYSVNQKVGNGLMSGRGQRSHRGPRVSLKWEVVGRRGWFWEGWEGVCGLRGKSSHWSPELSWFLRVFQLQTQLMCFSIISSYALHSG